MIYLYIVMRKVFDPHEMAFPDDKKPVEICAFNSSEDKNNFRNGKNVNSKSSNSVNKGNLLTADRLLSWRVVIKPFALWPKSIEEVFYNIYKSLYRKS